MGTPDKEKLSSSIVVGFTPTFMGKFKKPIEKSESLVWPPKISKRKTTKKVFISEGYSKGRAGSLTPNGKNLKLEPKDDVQFSRYENISDVSKKLDVEGNSGNQLWTKLKGFSSNTLKKNKKRNRSENSTSS